MVALKGSRHLNIIIRRHPVSHVAFKFIACWKLSWIVNISHILYGTSMEGGKLYLFLFCGVHSGTEVNLWEQPCEHTEEAVRQWPFCKTEVGHSQIQNAWLLQCSLPSTVDRNLQMIALHYPSSKTWFNKPLKVHVLPLESPKHNIKYRLINNLMTSYIDISCP